MIKVFTHCLRFIYIIFNIKSFLLGLLFFVFISIGGSDNVGISINISHTIRACTFVYKLKPDTSNTKYTFLIGAFDAFAGELIEYESTYRCQNIDIFCFE